MCVQLTSITFLVIWLSVLISVTQEWRYCGLVYKDFLINNLELKCSFVWCWKYHKSWSNGTAKLHISVDLLCDSSAAEPHNLVNLFHISVDLLCVTLWHNGCRATQLGKFTSWHNGRQTKPSLMHVNQESQTGTNHADKYEGLIQSKI